LAWAVALAAELVLVVAMIGRLMIRRHHGTALRQRRQSLGESEISVIERAPSDKRKEDRYRPDRNDRDERGKQRTLVSVVNQGEVPPTFVCVNLGHRFVLRRLQ
jgi:hypothetical protein